MPPGPLEHQKNMTIDRQIMTCTHKCVILGMNGVATARHGLILILSQGGATSPNNISRCRLGLHNAIQRIKTMLTNQTNEDRRKHIFRELLVNSCHPDPRCVWKVGSGAHLLPPLRLDPLDPLDQLDPLDRVKNFQTSFFASRAYEFD